MYTNMSWTNFVMVSVKFKNTKIEEKKIDEYGLQI